MSQPPSPAPPHLQALLDSFRGQLYWYGGDLPAPPYDTSNWENFVEAATILPALADNCHRLIEKRLGYRPPRSIMEVQAAFLRALIQHHRSGSLSDEDFKMQADQCIKGVRNFDMQVPLEEAPPTVARERYDSYLPAYQDQARNRLTHYLGYAPALEHSIIVELWLRQVMARDQYALPQSKTPLDYKAVMLVRYRETLAKEGLDAAHNLALPADTSVLD